MTSSPQPPPISRAREWARETFFPKGTRRAGRERALQFLFQSEFNRADTLDASLDLFWEQDDLAFADELARYAKEHGPVLPNRQKEVAKMRRQIRRFADAIIRDVLLHHRELDEIIAGASENWGIDRMGTVDRNILRIGACEILYHPDVPPVVAINEAVDLAKLYSSFESGRFVNGILDHLLKNTQAAASDDAPPPPPTETP